MKKKLLIVCQFFLFFSGLFAQTEEPEKQLVNETFLGNRTVNIQTVETLKKKTLGYRILHRFNEFQSNAYGFWGVDGPAVVGLQLDYGITNRFTVGISHMTWNKMIDVYGKYKILSQTKSNSMPFSMSIYAKAGLNNMRSTDLFGLSGFGSFNPLSNRLTYVAQLMLARKFGERFSLQLSPTWIHYNLDYGTYLLTAHSHEIFALTGQAEFKITKHFGLDLEYTHVLNNKYVDAATRNQFHDNLATGIEIKTAGHIFQIFLVNVFPIDEEFAIPFNSFNFFDWNKKDGVPGGFRFGFNIQRDFHL